MIRRLVNRFFGAQEGRIIIIGLDGPGKTTILYQLKLGEIVTTIPTIGFNVETIDWHSQFGKLRLTMWDVGGCDKIRPLWRHYFANLAAVVYVVDSNDRERVSESVLECTRLMAELDGQGAPGVIPFLILANKQDLSNAMTSDEIRRHFAKNMTQRPAAVFPTRALAKFADTGLPAAFDWLAAQLLARKAMGPETSVAKEIEPTTSAEAPPLAEKLEAYLLRAENDSSPEEFLEQFKALNLPSWDHYTHLRLAYIILTKYGRQQGKDMIFDGIKHYIANSSRTNGRTFHLTMTYFWIQIVHFGIRSVPEETTDQGKVVDDFGRFLLVNPFVADGNLWADYFSKEVMMSPEAKDGVVLPDKKPLPNLVARESIRGKN